MSKNTPIQLSASKIKTFETCSWLYYCKYVLKMPDEPNAGASRGTVSHLVFEVLLNTRHKKEFDAIIKENSVKASKSVYRLIIKQCRKLNILTPEHVELICNMVLVGLKQNFFCEGSEKVVSESYFKLESPNYIINGYIDKLAIHKDRIEIIDYKSSKQKFSEEEINYNLQNLMYSLACYKSNGVIPKVKFIFLRFPKKPEQEAPQCNENSLLGFEQYLDRLAKTINEFNEEKAKKSLAANDITKKWMCGKNEYRGQQKNDGTLIWGCQYKFPCIYYIAINKEGKVVKSSFENDIPTSDNYIVHKKQYLGCPAFNKKRTIALVDDEL